MEVRVEILKQTITMQYGTLNQGDILCTNRAFAAHLVDDCGAAQYCASPVTQQPAAAVEALEEQLVVSATAVPTVAQPELDANVAAGKVVGDTVAIASDSVQPGALTIVETPATDLAVQTSAQDHESAATEPAGPVTRKTKTAAKKE